ncbi:hypothetical protein LF599_14610 [Pseudodesulfovibrio thermohalotolerans]|uniref:hypothetical protein n=1 Tax=Pseudodesulfovibrio thermohalotolerans TaxID=2880651 RepID=UPI0024422A45|nr:hypothetical protein [Pseudodesulfovibrio thermohalotolerans]WFS61886.1 hypothetical protein LF599_14610 [Pseudodesulfovibrio thermohalotolerans]
MLRDDIRTALNAIVDNSDPIYRLRNNFCGAKYDRDHLEAAGLQLAYEKGECVWYESSHGRAGEERTVRYCLHESGYLRDVIALKFVADGYIGDIQRQAHSEFPYEDEIRNILSSGITVPIGITAEDEFYFLTHAWAFDKPDGVSEQTRKAYIWIARLRELMDTDEVQAKRYVVGAARWPEYLDFGLLQAEAAMLASQLRMEVEAAIFALKAIDSGLEDAELWNYVGCAIDRLNLYELAFLTFIHAAKLKLDEPQYQKNVWLLGKRVLENHLEKRAFKEALDVAEQLLKYPEQASEENLEMAETASGLCCEGLGLLDEAASCYHASWKKNQDNLVAHLGLNRLQEEDVSKRQEALEAQLKSFPRVPQEVEDADRLLTEFIEGYGHGSHWESLVPSVEDFFEHNLPGIIEKMKVLEKVDIPPCERVRGVAHTACAGVYPVDEQLFAMPIITMAEGEHGNRLDSAFPSATSGEGIELRVVGLKEWENGVEGSVDVELPSGRSLTLFDPKHFKNRSVYRPDHNYPFALNAFAWRLEEAEEQEFEITEGPLTFLEDGEYRDKGPQKVIMGKEMSILWDDFEYPAEYSYRLSVLDVDWTEFMGHRVCVISTQYAGEDDWVPLTLYAGEHLLTEYTPKPGDAIQGNLWLQGYLLSEEGVPVEAEDEVDSPFMGRLSFSKERGTNIFGTNHLEAALNASEGLQSYARLTFRLENQPQYVAEGQNGKRFFVYIKEFDVEKQEWSQAIQEASAFMETRTSLRDLPLHIVGVGYKDVGKGYVFSYHGWESFEKDLMDSGH